MPPGNSEVTRCEKCSLTSAKAASKTCMISSSRVRMTWWSSRRAERTSSTWDSRNWWRSLSSDELLERQRVDRAQGRQLGLELADPGGRVGALRELRRRGRHGPIRSAGQLPAQRLDHRLTPDGRLDQVQLDLLETAAGSGQFVLVGGALSAQFLEPGPAGADRLELEPVALAQFRQGRVQAFLGRGHHDQQPLHGGGVRLQSPPALGRLTALVGVPGQPPLDLLQPLGSAPAGARPGRPTGPPTRPAVTAASAIRSSIRRAPHRAARRPLGRPGPGRLQAGQLLAELRPPASMSRAIRSSSSAWSRRTSSSSAARASQVVGHPLTGRPGRLVGDLVAVVGPDRLGGGGPGGLHLGPRRRCAPRPSRTRQRRPSSARALASSTTAAVTTPPRGPHPPAGGREPVPVPGDDHQVGTGQGQVDGLGPPAQGAARPGQQRVERGLQAREVAAAGARPHMPADRLGPGRCPGPARSAGSAPRRRRTIR